MEKSKPLFTEKSKWKDPDKIVFYKNIEGYIGNPGGGVEKGESIEQAIKRELIEEAQLKLIDWKTIGFEQVFYPNKLESKKKSCFLRIVAKVELIDKPINDPDKKAIGRVVVDINEAAEKLNWGEKGEKLKDTDKEIRKFCKELGIKLPF